MHATGPAIKHISDEDIQSAINVGHALIPHALKVFDAMRLDKAHDNARVVLGWIRRNGLTEFTRRDCHRYHHSRFRKVEELDPVLKVLVDTDWIRERESEGRQGRPSRVFDVNPAANKKCNL